ncbi:phosphatidylglycerophosphatase A [Candidatus Pandoraea novymonadis]|uniref:Phosphatidylglycerophosphatase A n=1 Tax=Candidatus Pandoraea novymonadis TaxID=1808959 RepID=A0ABX5FH91_9BURK|nr:phosphatidylglycerophosphatase A [Candidatus Pandoraea novymonadis]PSB92362.1 Phosphatidylglycerophosphatase A [Candidatus Pandoraea novymonadis]
MSTKQPTADRTESQRTPNTGFLLSHPAHLFSLGFGSGLSPLAPGTAGTAFSWISYLVLNQYLTTSGWFILIGVGFLSGIWLCGFTAQKLSIADPKSIVWDEIIAFWAILLLITPTSFTRQFFAFLIFRFFDVVKPPPIRYFDRTVKGGFGIMLDDIIAAFCTLFIIAMCHSI